MAGPPPGRSVRARGAGGGRTRPVLLLPAAADDDDDAAAAAADAAAAAAARGPFPGFGDRLFAGDRGRMRAPLVLCRRNALAVRTGDPYGAVCVRLPTGE